MIATAETVDDFAAFGIRAFTTSRQAGTFGLGGPDPVAEVMGRWAALRRAVGSAGARLATAHQVHGARVVTHAPGWQGWLRVDDADGHAAAGGPVMLAVSVADCVPVFLAHPSGAVALLHSGWKGTAGRIVVEGIQALAALGCAPADLHVHLGPSICGRCYEVSPEVYHQVTGRTVGAPTPVDLRAEIAAHARSAGVRRLTTSPLCTRCDNDRLFSHRAGDAGRQLGVVAVSA